MNTSLQHSNVYQSTIKQVVAHFRGQTLFEAEDHMQMLWEKILENVSYFDNLPAREVGPVVFTSLRNFTVDEIRKANTRYHVNMPLFENNEMELTEIVDSFLFRFSGRESKTQESQFSMKQLSETIGRWYTCQNDNAKKIIKEFLHPSVDTLEKWEMTKLKEPVYRQYDEYIPMNWIVKQLGFSHLLGNNILRDLRFHLQCAGYKRRLS